jgi:hypothetical protein
MIKKIFVFGILLLALFQFSSSLVLEELNPNLNAGETFVGRIEADLVRSISNSDVKVYEGRREVYLEKNIYRVDNLTFIYVIFTKSGNFRIEINDILYNYGGNTKWGSITKEVSVSDKQSKSLSVKPGIVYGSNISVVLSNVGSEALQVGLQNQNVNVPVGTFRRVYLNPEKEFFYLSVQSYGKTFTIPVIYFNLTEPVEEPSYFPITLTQHSPPDGLNTNETNVLFNCSAKASSSVIKKLDLYVNGIWKETKVSAGTDALALTFSGFFEYGNYSWFCRATSTYEDKLYNSLIRNFKLSEFDCEEPRKVCNDSKDSLCVDGKWRCSYDCLGNSVECWDGSMAFCVNWEWVCPPEEISNGKLVNETNETINETEVVIVEDFNLIGSDIRGNLTMNKSYTFKVLLENNLNATIFLNAYSDSKRINFPRGISLEPFEKRNFSFEFFSENQGVFSGNITLSSKNLTKNISFFFYVLGSGEEFEEFFNESVFDKKVCSDVGQVCSFNQECIGGSFRYVGGQICCVGGKCLAPEEPKEPKKKYVVGIFSLIIAGVIGFVLYSKFKNVKPKSKL